MSDEQRKKTDKLTFASYVKRRTTVQEAVRSGNSETSTGKPTWGDGATYSRSDEFTELAEKLAGILASGSTLDAPRARDVLTRMHALRKEAADQGTTIDHWQGRYVKVLKLPSSSISTLQVRSALSHFKLYELGPNPYMPLEFSYAPTQVPPDDWALWAIQRDPANEALVGDLLRHCFAMPVLANMLARVDRAGSRVRPEWARISAFWRPALDAVAKDSVLTPLAHLPDWRNVVLDGSASPGFPFSVMPIAEGSTKPMSTVRDVYARDDGAFFEAHVQTVLDHILKPSKCPAPDQRLLLYSLQAGNVKHVLRAELGEKPNRAIFSSPLVLRHLAGAISQPFYENWHHPGSLLGSSFAHGGVLRILGTVLRCEASLDAVMEHLEVVPGEIAHMHPSVRKVRVKRGLLFAPDKSEFDMGMRIEPMQAFAKYTEGVLPLVDQLPASEHVKHKAWCRINAFGHRCDGENKQVLTNHRVVIEMPENNPSGSMWTTTRNTWVDIAAEDAISRLAWHNVYKNRDYEKFLHISAYGDDTVDYFFDSNYDVPKLVKEMIKVAPTIGWEYKKGTDLLTNVLSDLEILGRHIYAWVEDGKPIGFFGARPREKLFRSLIYPKAYIKVEGVNPASIRQARLVMIADEAFCYPVEHQLALRIHEQSAKTFATRPDMSAMSSFDPMFDVYKDKHILGPRTWVESAMLHMGVSPVIVRAAVTTGLSDEEDLEVDLDTPSKPAAAGGPAARPERKEEKKNLPVEEELDAAI